MNPNRLVSTFACLFAAAIAIHAPPAAGAVRVPSEAAKTAPVTPAPTWRVAGFPQARALRMQYREMPASRILLVEKRNATRQAKPIQIGIERDASTDGVTDTLPPLNWVALKDGGSAARIEVRSPVAMALRVGLKVNALSPRAELRFAGSSDPSRVVAAMSGREILQLTDPMKLFWTPSTDGETQYIEVYLPAGVPTGSTRLQAPRLSHLLADSTNDFRILPKIGESGSCNVDTACRVGELGADFVSAKNAVAHMQFVIAGEGTFICTGTLLADTVASSQIPYFYSANHCIDNQAVASTLNTFWKYEASGCASGVAAANVQLTGGATYLYSDPDTGTTTTNGTDGLLLRLNNPPPAGSEFAGWDSAPLAASSNIIGIHHPKGDVKKVSSGKQMSVDGYQNAVAWLSGTTEGGSSGSGLFTADASGYHLRGGLYGGSALCSNSGSTANIDNRDYYSRFDVVFPHIEEYLSPAASHVAPVANFIFASNGLTTTFTDTSTDSDGTVVSRTWNFGDGTSSTAANPVKTFAAAGAYNVTLTVTDNDGLSHSLARAVVVTKPKLPVHDFNADGKSDLLWRQIATGANAAWYSANSANAMNLVTVTGQAWKIAGVGDFNGDGVSDILWRNGTTGANTIWKSGNQATQQAVTGIIDFGWKIVGVGDFNGDRKSDILWRHDTRGANTIWYSGNSATLLNLTSVTGTAWKVAGIGDFNGDGKSDILWRNNGSGGNTIWLTGNHATQQAVTTITNLNWKVAGIGDFNGDGKSDILWRDAGTGANAIWLSANNAMQQVVTSVTSQAWGVAAVGDYDGNGRSDILWHEANTGANAIWRGGSNANQQPVTTVTNTAWTIIP